MPKVTALVIQHSIKLARLMEFLYRSCWTSWRWWIREPSSSHNSHLYQLQEPIMQPFRIQSTFRTEYVNYKLKNPTMSFYRQRSATGISSQWFCHTEYTLVILNQCRFLKEKSNRIMTRTKLEAKKLTGHTNQFSGTWKNCN
jgi:hypothetical protein